MALIGIRFDLRRPPFAKVSHAEQYRACIDMCGWADEQGLDIAVLSEHHGVEDGFMSAPLAIAAAIAGRTKSIQINVAAVLIPLHDPVRFAEEAAAVSLLSGGRFSFVAGLGYRHEEFEMAGVERKRRGSILEESIDVIRKSWTGEPFEWRGRTVRATPPPAFPPMMMLGGSTEKAARRAAKLRMGFFPAVGDPRLAEIYEEECKHLGFTGGFVSMPGGPGFVHVTEDPERDWEVIGPHALWDAETYASWQPAGQRSEVSVHATTLDDLKKSGVFAVVTPDECVEMVRQQGRLILHPLMGGLDPEFSWKGLRLFQEKVLPRIRQL
ncbi:LLM class flavin-dependent oxidoreductase [bacterium]|nr:LLM class flavin-dependent oxidoreductase [bacterium]